MSEQIFRDARIEINAVVLSDRGNEVRLEMGRETRDKSTFGGNTRVNKGGLKTWTITVNFLQDYAAGEVDATLWPLYDNGTEFAIKVRPTSAAISATNPEFSGTGIITSYQPVGGAHGDLQAASVTIEAAGDMARATA